MQVNELQAMTRIVFPSKGMEWIKPFRDWDRHTSPVLFSSSPMDYLLAFHLYEEQTGGASIFDLFRWRQFQYALNMNGSKLAYTPMRILSRSKGTSLEFQRPSAWDSAELIQFHVKWLDNDTYLLLGRLLDDSTLVYLQLYHHGKRNGMACSWYRSGQIHCCGSFTDDEPDGLWIRWHDTGLYSHLSMLTPPSERSAVSETSFEAVMTQTDEKAGLQTKDTEQKEWSQRSAVSSSSSSSSEEDQASSSSKSEAGESNEDHQDESRDVFGMDQPKQTWYQHYLEVVTHPYRNEQSVQTSISKDGGEIIQYARWPWPCKLLELKYDTTTGQPLQLHRWCWYRIQMGMEQIVSYEKGTGQCTKAESYLHTRHKSCPHGIWRNGEGDVLEQYWYGRTLNGFGLRNRTLSQSKLV